MSKSVGALGGLLIAGVGLAMVYAMSKNDGTVLLKEFPNPVLPDPVLPVVTPSYTPSGTIDPGPPGGTGGQQVGDVTFPIGTDPYPATGAFGWGYFANVTGGVYIKAQGQNLAYLRAVAAANARSGGEGVREINYAQAVGYGLSLFNEWAGMY
jgi:hypothetical protein